jgi:hypothetical protein
MNEEQLKALISNLYRSRDGYDFWLNVCAFLVVVGVVAEIVFVIREYWEELHDWRRGIIKIPSRPSRAWLLIELIGVILVSIGVGGEFFIDVKVGNIDTQIRQSNSQLVTLLEQHVALIDKSAGDANERAGIANQAANKAQENTEKARVDEKRLDNENLKLQTQVEQEKIERAKVEEKYSTRSLSQANAKILVDILKQYPLKPTEPVEVESYTGAPDGVRYGLQIVNAINDPASGWKAKFGSQTTIGGTLTGVVLVIHDVAATPQWAVALQAALRVSGIGGEGVPNPDAAPGSVVILICPKN